jgi:hypothetical protein
MQSNLWALHVELFGPADDEYPAQPHPLPLRADCCSSRPAVRVVLPPRAARSEKSELFLCGHHHRASSESLRSAGAVSFTATGALIDADNAWATA